MSQERVGAALAGGLIKAVNDIVTDEKITYDEYNALKTRLISVGETGEWPLLLDVWVTHFADPAMTIVMF